MHLLNKALNSYVKARTEEFDQISDERKDTLNLIVEYIKSKIDLQESAQMVCICTHNSRRSHFAHIWAQIAAYHFGFEKVQVFSGGTEATAFNPNAVNAIQRSGFEVEVLKTGENPLYELKFNDQNEGIKCFSKEYDHEENPKTKFLALMVCSDADANCPFIPLAEKRVSLPFLDPKLSDGSAEQDKVYDERCAQIAREMLFAFSKI
ncbi:MAG: protein-tyrosine-phosphatase [Cytophagales bacterium]